MELRNPLALGPFPIFVITVISSPVVKCLLCKSHWEWLFHRSAHCCCQYRAPWGLHRASTQKRKGNTSLRSFVSMRWCSLHCSYALPKHFRMLLTYEITAEKIYRVWCIFLPRLQQHDQSRFYGHRGNKIFSSGGNYFYWVCNFKVVDGGRGVHFP